MFYKKAVLKKFTIIHRKTPVLESFFPTQVLSCEYYEIFKNTYFEKHLRMAASYYFGVVCLRKKIFEIEGLYLGSY